MSDGAAPKNLLHALPRVIATLVAVHACTAVTRVTASLWALDQGYGEWTVGVLHGLLAVAPVGLALWAGRLADRHGFHRPVAIGAGLGFAGAFAAFALPSMPAVALSCLLTGGAISVAAVAIQREAGLMAAAPGDLKRIFGWISLAPALSNTIAPVGAGLLIDHLGFRWAFGFAVILPAIAWALARRVPRHGAPPDPGRPAAPPAWHLLRHAPLRNLLLVNVVMSACWDVHAFVVPVLGHERGLSASSIGLVLGSFAVASTIVRFAIANHAHDTDEQKAIRAAMLLATGVLAVYAQLPGTGGLMAGSALLGLALGSVQPMVLSTLHQVTPSDRHGQALGLRMVMVNAVTVVMPVGFGVIASASLAAAPMWLMAGLLVVAQAPASAIRRRKG